MQKDDLTQRNQELESENQILQAENEYLIKQIEETLLPGLVAESISRHEQPDLILARTLEQIALIKNLPFGAFGELLDDEIFILKAYATFREDSTGEDQISLSKEVIQSLDRGAQVFSGDELETQGISIQLAESAFAPAEVLLFPFSTRLILQGVLILVADSAEVQLSGFALLLQRVMAIIISRLDNLSLVQELQHLNLALNMEVDRRVGELSATNEQLRETMTQRLRMEDALLRQRDLITNISETSPVGITILDKQGEITYANAQAEKVLGLAHSQIEGRQYNAPEWKISDYKGDPFPKDQLPFAQVKRTSQPVYNVQHAIEWPDGRRVLLAINAAPLFDDDFRVDGMVAVIEDVTEQVAADLAFRRLQNFNADIVQNVSEGIAIQDAEGYFSFVNPAAARLLGYRAEALVGAHWHEIIPPDQQAIVEAADERRKDGIADRYEVTLKRKDGQRFPVLVSGRPRIDSQTGEFIGTLAVFADITEQKQAETARLAQRDLALQLSAATGVENVLRLCVEFALDNTAMEVGGIYLIDKYTDDLYLAYAQGLSANFVEQAGFFAAGSQLARLVQAGEPVYQSFSTADFPSDDFITQEALTAIAVLPIKFEGKLIACLSLGACTVDAVSHNTKDFLEMIAAQVGSSLARAQTEDQLKQRVGQLALLNGIGEKIAAVLDLENLLSLTAQLVQTSFGYQHVALFTINHEAEAVVLRTIAGEFIDLFPRDHALKLGQGVVGSVALQNETILANDVASEDRYVNLYPDRVQTRAELSVPIQIGGEVAGVIDVQSSQQNTFDESDVLMMETLADQVAVAIHNANLHQSVQAELAERTRIEMALRESEEKFRNIIQSSPMGMHMYQLESDERLVFIDANPAADLMLGVNNRQFIGKTIEHAFPALADTELPEKYRRAAKSGQPWTTEQIDYADGEINGAFEVYAFQTSPGRMVALFLEITERKRSEEALRRSENTLSSIFRAAPTGIGLVSNRKMLEINRRICDMTGYSPEELIGQNARILYPTDADYEYVGREKYRQIEACGTGTVETRWQRKDGQIIDILMSSTPIDPDDLTVGVTFTALDITERKRSEEALRQSENTLGSIIRGAPTGIALISEQVFLQVNQRICEMTGYERDTLIEENIRILYPTERHFSYYVREVYRQIEALGSATIETRWVRKDEQVIDILLNATPVDIDNLAGGVTLTALDITERKLAEARIQRQLRRLAALNQVDAAITGNLDLDRITDLLLEQTVRQLDVSAASILLYHPVTQTLKYFAGYGFYTDAIKSANLRLGQDFAGRVALERRTIMATDNDRGFLECEPFNREGFRSYYGVPLIAKGQIKGVLEVFDQKHLSPSAGWLSFLETIAGQAAIAIENSEMVDSLERSNLELRSAYYNTLEGWAKALELRDFETEGHSRRVTELTLQVARSVGIPDSELEHVQRGALLHDVGKMGIPDGILLKNGPLDEDEWSIMRQHPVYAYEMLSSIEFLRPSLDIPLYHHEKWDGTGYPYGLQGEAIPISARVFAVVDVWDALSSDRPYRAALDQNVVLGHIKAQSGKHFDPQVVDAFLQILSENP